MHGVAPNGTLSARGPRLPQSHKSRFVRHRCPGIAAHPRPCGALSGGSVDGARSTSGLDFGPGHPGRDAGARCRRGARALGPPGVVGAGIQPRQGGGRGLSDLARAAEAGRSRRNGLCCGEAARGRVSAALRPRSSFSFSRSSRRRARRLAIAAACCSPSFLMTARLALRRSPPCPRGTLRERRAADRPRPYRSVRGKSAEVAGTRASEGDLRPDGNDERDRMALVVRHEFPAAL